MLGWEAGVAVGFGAGGGGGDIGGRRGCGCCWMWEVAVEQ